MRPLPLLIVRDFEVVDSASSYDEAIAAAKAQAAEWPSDTTYVYQALASAKSDIRVTVTAPIVQVKQ
jgi:hypothetical protein